MEIQDLNPDIQCLPEGVAKQVVAYSEKRLLRHQVHEFVGKKSCPIFTVEGSKLEIGMFLGKGSFSEAYYLDEDMAIKVLQPKLLHKPQNFAACAADLVREGMILHTLQHPNVMKCHAMGELSAFSSGRHDACCLVLDRLSCTLNVQLQNWRQQTRLLHPCKEQKCTGLENAWFRISGGAHRRRQETLIQRTEILCQLADALRYLHACRILHRDLKPENLGLTKGGVLKVFDLDVCRILPPEAVQYPDKTFQFTRHVGSPRYMAPEVARGQNYNAKADVYAFGLICYELLSLKRAYEDIPSKHLSHRVINEGVRPNMPQSWPEPVANLVQRCWTERVEKRPTMNQVLCQLRSTLDHMTGPTTATAQNKSTTTRSYHEESGCTHRMESDIEHVFLGPAQ